MCGVNTQKTLHNDGNNEHPPFQERAYIVPQRGPGSMSHQQKGLRGAGSNQMSGFERPTNTWSLEWTHWTWAVPELPLPVCLSPCPPASLGQGCPGLSRSRYTGWRGETLQGPCMTCLLLNLLNVTLPWLVMVQLEQYPFYSLKHRVGSHPKTSTFAVPTPWIFPPQIFAWLTSSHH